jgi:heavy metal sensor kinase
MSMRLPIRLRLTLAFAIGMAVVLASLGAFLYLRLGHELLGEIDMALRSRAQVVEAGVRNGSFDAQSGGLVDADEAYAQVLDGSGAIRQSSPQVASAPLVPASALPSTTPVFATRRVTGLEDPARLLMVPLEGGTTYIVVGATLSDRHEALDRLLVLFAIGGPVALALMSLAGWLLAGAALRPVERMRREAAAISASEPDRRLAVPPTGDELDRLATTLNEMLQRLQDALARERRFVDDASHELRTPLGILQGELELSLSRPRSSQELETALRRASAETDRLVRLAEDLLVLARTEDGRLPVRREDAALARVVGEACEGRRALARDGGVSLEVDTGEDRANIDPVRVRQAVENLVDNAVRHSPAGAAVRVSAHREDGRVRIRVDDAGPGFAPSALATVFEPFAGAGDGGAGLGLAIVRAVALSHGGDAVAENPPGGGARVTLTLRAEDGTSESGETENDGPGGHEDPAGNVDHRFNGQE